jgi:hypothetical protein
LYAVDAAGAGEGSAMGRRNEWSNEVRMQTRQVLFLIDKFRFHCERRATTKELAEVVQAVIAGGRAGFRRAVGGRARNARLGADGSRCLGELEDLLRTLHAGNRPSVQELAHAMDSLLVACVIWDTAASEETHIKARP